MLKHPTTYPLKLLGVAALYALLAKIVLVYFSPHGVVSIVWPQSGLALGVLLIGGKRYFPGVFLGAFLANAMAGLALSVSAAIATGNTLEALLGAWLLTRNGKFDLSLRSLRDYLRLVVLAGLFACSVAALNGATTLLLSGLLTAGTYFPNLLHWWMSDVLGIMLVTPFMLAWRRPPDDWLEPKRVAEAALVLGLTLLAGQMIFLDWFHDTLGQLALGYWIFLLVVWVAMRLGTHGVVVILATTAIQALLGAHQGTGFFAHDIAKTGLANYWLYMMTLSVVGMALATYFTERKQLERKLRHSEENLNRAQGIGQIGSWLLDIPTNRLEWSAETYRIFGIPQGEAVDLDIFAAAIHPDDRAFVLKAWGEAMAGAPYDIEHRIVVGGQERWVRERAQIERDSEGRPFTGIGTVQDITERKHAEMELRTLSTAIEQSPLSIVITDLDAKIQYINPYFTNLTGYSRDEVIGQSPRILQSGQTPKETYAELWKALVNGQAWQGELTNKRKNGELYWEEAHIAPVTDSAGVTTHYVAVKLDITERKRAEAKIVAINIRLATLVETIPDIVIFKDGEGRWLIANEPAKQLFCLHDIPWQGKTSMELAGLRPELREAHISYQAGDDKTWAAGKLSLFEEKITSAKGGLRTFEAYKIPSFNNNGSRNGLVIVARDITERKQYEERLQSASSELEQANAQIEEERAQLAERVVERTKQLLQVNRAKDSFLATMSHEIRTPLGGLLGMMELISLSRLDGEQREMLQAARDSGQSLLRIVDDILDWSKIEAGKLELSPQAATITEITKGVVSTYSPLASAKGLLLRQRVDSKLGAAHIFDSLRLSQILNNFTSNAIKFTERGIIEISAELIVQHEGIEQVRFCVKDSGIGIDKEQQARLFQHYEQASADTARMYGGTGLGLAICRSLAELMEGTISVESAVGVGSTFCFTVSLPVASPAAQRDLQLRQARGGDIEEGSDSIPGIAPLAAGAKRMLVVDDHPINRMLLKQQLELLGMHAEDAAYGIVALSLWQTGRFDLIITDCHMPEMDGYELTRSIREMESHDGRQRVPIIAWTANVLAEEEEHCRAVGMDDMLTKPTELADLKAMLSKWLANADVPAAEAPLTSAKGAIPSHLAAAADTPIDFSMLKKITRNPVAQVEMLQEFNLHNRGDIFNLKAALKDGNPAAVARLAHRIKGASRMVGALELDGICTAIEKAAMQGDMEGARRAAEPALGAAVERLEAAIGKFIGGQ